MPRSFACASVRRARSAHTKRAVRLLAQPLFSAVFGLFSVFRDYADCGCDFAVSLSGGSHPYRCRHERRTPYVAVRCRASGFTTDRTDRTGHRRRRCCRYRHSGRSGCRHSGRCRYRRCRCSADAVPACWRSSSWSLPGRASLRDPMVLPPRTTVSFTLSPMAEART